MRCPVPTCKLFTSHFLRNTSWDEPSDEHAHLYPGTAMLARPYLESFVLHEVQIDLGNNNGFGLFVSYGLDIRNLPYDGNRHRSHHQNNYGTHRRLQIALYPRDAALTEDRGEHSEDE